MRIRWQSIGAKYWHPILFVPRHGHFHPDGRIAYVIDRWVQDRPPFIWEGRAWGIEWRKLLIVFGSLEDRRRTQEQPR
jgi:hypothetical protein